MKPETAPTKKTVPNWVKRKPIFIILGGIAVLGVAIAGFVVESPSKKRLSIQYAISAGEKQINPNLDLGKRFDELKNNGIKAYAEEDYVKARDLFDDIRNKAKRQREDSEVGSLPYKEAERALQDPEVLIYRNNAKVRIRHRKGEPIYRIAAAVPLTNLEGEPFDTGKLMLFGIAQAQDKAVNPSSGAQKINLEIMIVNDFNDPGKAKDIARDVTQMSGDSQILAVIGHYTSVASCSALPDYVKARIPLVSPLSTKANIREECGGRDFFFRVTSSTQVEAQTLVGYLHAVKKISKPKIAVFYNKEDQNYSVDLRNQFSNSLKAIQGEIIDKVNEQDFDLSDPNFDPKAALKLVADADAIAILADGRIGNDATFERAIATIKANNGEKIVLGSNPLYEGDALEKIKKKIGLDKLQDKLILATDWHSSCAPKTFDEQTAEYWLGRVNRKTALSYEATQVLIAMLKEGITSEDIKEVLSQKPSVTSDVFEERTGIDFDKYGDREQFKTRILITPSSDEKNPFELVDKTSCF